MAGLLIKDIPREVHEWLKREAKRNRRSMTQQAIVVLEERMHRFRALKFPPPARTRTLLTAEFIGQRRSYMIVDSKIITARNLTSVLSSAPKRLSKRTQYDHCCPVASEFELILATRLKPQIALSMRLTFGKGSQVSW
jgi:hypothetical protein